MHRKSGGVNLKGHKPEYVLGMSSSWALPSAISVIYRKAFSTPARWKSSGIIQIGADFN